MNNKNVARHGLSFIGGTPKVSRYYNDDESKEIDIMVCRDSIYKDTLVFSTIGLCQYDIGLKVEKRDLRVELLSIGNKKDEKWANILASTAFEVMDTGSCGYGAIIQSVVREYFPCSSLEHVLLLSPAFWDNYDTLSDDETIVAWLQLLPISESERQFVLTNGVEKFDKLLEEKETDVLDMERLSII